MNTHPIIAELIADGHKFSAGLTDAASEVGDFADKAMAHVHHLAQASEGTLKKIGTVAAGAGAAAGASLAAGLASNMNTEVATDKLAAQLGLSAQDAGKAGKLAADLYRSNFGDDIGQVNEAVKAVVQNMNVSLEDVDFQPITGQVISLAQTFDQDFNAVTMAAGQLLKTGLATDAQDALDIVAAGFQNGADKSGDFLDTLNEYGTQFRKFGFDGQQATGLISQGLQAGARDGDLVADAIKEFSIRAIDGSEATAAGFKEIGINADRMAKQIAAGGPAARQGLDTVLDRLRAIKDPVKQSQAAVALFGTQAEDLGKALYALDPSTAVQALGDVAGAAQGVSDTVGDNAQAKIETYKRKLVGIAQDAANAHPALAGVAAAVSLVGPAVFGVLAPLASLAAARAAQTAATAAATTAEATNTATTKVGLVSRVASTIAAGASAVAQGVAAVATGAWTAAQWLLNAAMTANPIGLVIAAIALLVAGIIIAWKHSETFRSIVTGAFHAVWGVVQGLWGWIKGHWPLLLSILTGPVGAAVIYIVRHWDQVVGFVTGLPGRIRSAASGMWDGIKDSFRSALNWIIDKWNGLEFKIGGQSVFGHSLPSVTIGTPDLPHFADGGWVPGPPGAPLLAVVHGGEYVVSQDMQNGRTSYGGPSGGGAQVIELHTHTHLDGREIHKSVQTHEVQYQDRNGRSGFEKKAG